MGREVLEEEVPLVQLVQHTLVVQEIHLQHLHHKGIMVVDLPAGLHMLGVGVVEHLPWDRTVTENLRGEEEQEKIKLWD